MQDFKQSHPIPQKVKQNIKESLDTSLKSPYSTRNKSYDTSNSQSTRPPPLAKNNTVNESTSDSIKNFDNKLGVTRAKDPLMDSIPTDAENENTIRATVSLEKSNNHSMSDLRKSTVSTSKKIMNKNEYKNKELLLKLPPIRKFSNPEEIQIQKTSDVFYQAKIERAFRLKENTYLMNLARQHFLQTFEAIKIGKTLKITETPKILNLSKKNPKFKTIFLDLDETLIHCDESSNNYTVKLNFPIEGGNTIQAGIRVRPFCFEFLEELSSFAEIIIFTASAPSYANVVLDYLDPKKKYFAHRLYRQHCTLEKGFYTKDLRIVNRRAEDIAIVDNSAFSFMTQTEFGIPILPYYHFTKDKELQSLIKFLKELVEEPDMRVKIKKAFFWHKYKDEDPYKTFQENFSF